MIKTHLINYTFNLSNKDDKEAWETLRKQLREGYPEYGPAHRGLMESWNRAGRSHCFTIGHDGMQEPKEVWLETNFLFSNQWNTTADSPNYPNFRVFDWALDATSGKLPPKTIKRGHFLIITEEMVKIRDETYTCGYCGHEYPDHDPAAQAFCNRCLGNEYLKEEDLSLLRLRPVSAGFRYETPELTEDEHDRLLPAYIEAQVSTQRKVLDKELAAVLAKADKAISDAITERDGMLWLFNHEIGVKNVMFYPHTGRFCLGWLTNLDPVTLPAWRAKLAGFPYPMDIKTTTGLVERTVPFVEEEQP